MKKVILFGIVGFALITLSTSCKKNWVCRCDAGTTYETTRAINKKTKKNAEKECEGAVQVGVVSFSGDNNCYLD